MLAIFDVDGTLIDSRAIIHRAAEVSFADLGLPPPAYDDLRRYVGLSLDVALGHLAPQLDAGALQGLTEAYKAAFRSFRADPAFVEPQYAGVQTMLDDLRAQGWTLAMATGKSRRGVEDILDMHGWRDLFAVSFCADDGPGKPHPHMVEQCLYHSGFGATQAVMIGDTSFDMIMAQAAGVTAWGVSWGFHTPDEIAAAGAEVIHHDMATLHGGLIDVRFNRSGS